MSKSTPLQAASTGGLDDADVDLTDMIRQDTQEPTHATRHNDEADASDAASQGDKEKIEPPSPKKPRTELDEAYPHLDSTPHPPLASQHTPHLITAPT